jgi:IS30 family transposase
MPKRKIYRRTNTNQFITNPSARFPEKLFNYLFDHKGQEFSRKKLAETFNVHPSTISRAYQELKGQVFIDVKRYKIFCINRLYQVNVEDFLEKKEKKEKNKSLDKRIKEEAILLSNPKIWKSDKAIRVTATVILYKTNPRLQHLVIDSLLKLFKPEIYDILACKDQLFIILKEEGDPLKTSLRLFDLYRYAATRSNDNPT